MNTVHLAIQLVPISKEAPYPIIDKAIEVIQKSGVKYVVGPMETVLEGEYDKLMTIIKQAQEASFAAGADELVVTLKIHARKNGSVTFEEKGLSR